MNGVINFQLGETNAGKGSRALFLIYIMRALETFVYLTFIVASEVMKLLLVLALILCSVQVRTIGDCDYSSLIFVAVN